MGRGNLEDLGADGNNYRLNDCHLLKNYIFIQDSCNFCYCKQIIVKYTIIRHIIQLSTIF
jgi:hypothetical protein